MCKEEIYQNQQILKDLVDLGSIVVSHVKYQNTELQKQNDIKEFVSVYLKMKQAFFEGLPSIFEAREELFYYLEILPLLFKNEEYFSVIQNKDRPAISYTELFKQMQYRFDRLKPMLSCK